METPNTRPFSGNEPLKLARQASRLFEPPTSIRTAVNILFPEILELDAQLRGDFALAGHKVHSRSFRTSLLAAGSALLSAIRRYAAAAGELPTWPPGPAQPMFLVEHESHYKQFAPVGAELCRRGVRFHLGFLTASQQRQHGAEWPESRLLPETLLAGTSRLARVRFVLVGAAQCVGVAWFAARSLRACPRKELLFCEVLRLAAKTLFPARVLERTLQAMNRASVYVMFKAEGPRHRMAGLTAGAFGVPTIAVQHGLMKPRIAYMRLPVTQYLVWSAAFREVLVKSQAGCEVQVCGAPFYDKMFAERATAGAVTSVRRILFLPNSGQSQTPRSEVLHCCELFCAFAARHPEISAAIKPHPGDASGSIAEFVERRPADGAPVRLIDRFEPLRIVDWDAVFTMNSTVGLEACIHRRPIVILASSEKYLMVRDYIAAGVAEWLTTVDGIEKFVRELPERYGTISAAQDAYCEMQLAHFGQAAQRVCDAIGKLHCAPVARPERGVNPVNFIRCPN